MSLVYVDKNANPGSKYITRVHHSRANVQFNGNYLATNKNLEFKNIKQRYLTMLSKTLYKGKNMSKQEYEVFRKELDSIIQSNPSKVADMFQEIQNRYAKSFNEISGQQSNRINELIGSLYKKRNLKNSDNSAEFLKTLNEIIEIIDENPKAFNDWETIINSKHNDEIQFLQDNEITFAMKAASLLKKYVGTDLTDGTINNVVENFTEFLPEQIGYAIEHGITTVNNSLTSVVPKSKVVKNAYFTGTQMRSSDLKGFEGIKSKAADSYHYSKISQDSKLMQLGNGSSKASVRIRMAVTTKQKTNKTGNYLKLVSYSGKNSILSAILNEIWPGYKANFKQSYAIYNGLAFKYDKKLGTDAVSQYYRIIRTNVIKVAAEKYLVGVRSDLTQSILVYNGMAYPMLSIISAIIDDATGKQDYGSTQGKNKDFFSVRLDVTAAYNNEWEPPKQPNIEAAKRRAIKAMNSIDRIKTYGQLNLKMLENKGFVSKYFKGLGIKLV